RLPVGVDMWWLGFSPDGKRLAVGCGDRSVKLWDLSTKRQVALTGHTSGVIWGAFSPDGRILATGSPDCTIRLWSLTTHRPIALPRGQKAAVGLLTFSPDGKTLVSASTDNTVKLWDWQRIAAPSRLDTFAERGGLVWAVSISPDSRTLA